MKLIENTMFNQLRFTIAQIKENYYAMQHENDELRKRITQMQKDYDKLKNDYDECKRNLEKTSQETSNSES